MFGKKKNEDDTEKVMKVSADNLTMITIGTIVKGIITIAGGLHLEGTLEGDIICKGKVDRKSTRLNSSHPPESRMPSSA